jgi:hypothetical protein
MTDTERIHRLERAVKNLIVMAVFDRVRSEPRLTLIVSAPFWS